MRNVKNVAGTLSGITVGRRTSRKGTEIAILWDNDEIEWVSEWDANWLSV